MPLMLLRGIPYLLALGRMLQGRSCLAPATSIFKDLKAGNLDAATRDESTGATCWGRWALAFGVSFWLGFWLRGLGSIERPVFGARDSQ